MTKMHSMLDNIAELKKFVKVDLSMIDPLLPFVQDAFQITAQNIGYDTAIKLYSSNGIIPTGFEDEEYFKRALDAYKYAYAAALIHVAAPHLDINITGVGLTTASQTNSVAASGERVNRFTTGLTDLLNNRISLLHDVLRHKLDLWPEYKNSRFCCVIEKSIVNDAADVAAASGIIILNQIFVSAKTKIITLNKSLLETFNPVFEKDDETLKKLAKVYISLHVFGNDAKALEESYNCLQEYIMQNADSLGYQKPVKFENSGQNPIFFM